MAEVDSDGTDALATRIAALPRPTPLPSRVTSAEAAAHEAFVSKMGESAIWAQYAEVAAAE
jgi:DNA polymerase-3 subunit epsilon